MAMKSTARKLLYTYHLYVHFTMHFSQRERVQDLLFLHRPGRQRLSINNRQCTYYE